MLKLSNLVKSVISSLFKRQDKSLPEEDATTDIAGTLEEISRQVKNEVVEQHLLDDDFFSPTHVLRPKAWEPVKIEAIASRREKNIRHCRLTPEQYEDIIENSLTALDLAGQIIDRNRAITSKLKKSPV